MVRRFGNVSQSLSTWTIIEYVLNGIEQSTVGFCLQILSIIIEASAAVESGLRRRQSQPAAHQIYDFPIQISKMHLRFARIQQTHRINEFTNFKVGQWIGDQRVWHTFAGIH